MFFVNGKEVSREEIERKNIRYSRHEMLAHAAGERVAICLEDTAELLCLILHLHEIGASVLPISTCPFEAARRQATRAKCKFLLYQNLDHWEILEASEKDASPMLLQFSSGTTGDPKLICRSKKDIDAEIQSTLIHFPELENRVSIVACPVTHSYGLISGFLTGLKRGNRVEIFSNTNPKSVIKSLMQHEHHLLYASPVYLEILSQFTSGMPVFDAAMTSGVSMSKQSFDLVRSRFRNIYQQYGCSEAGCISINRDLREPHCLGSALPHLQVSAGISVDQPEEIRVTGKSGNPICTGDLGYVENGEIYFVSRIDDMINTSGLNVYPREVENVLMQHDAVSEAVVFGVSDTLVGQKIHALIVCPFETISPEALRNWCAEQLMPHQIPHQIRVVPEIEKLSNGKVSRKNLAKSLA